MIDRIKERTQNGTIITLSPGDLEYLLARGELVFEEDTGLSGLIRILRFDAAVLVQETTQQDQIIVRSRPTIEDARAFVASRLKTYERMWDGCGCRVSYFDE